MKLSTSTGDFSCYFDSVSDKVKQYKGLPFKYINLEQTGNIPLLLNGDDYAVDALIDKLKEAAEYAGISYVLSHAPNLDAYSELNDEHYWSVINAIIRSMHVCRSLGIDRIVVHASSNKDFDYKTFYNLNKKFYGDLIPTMEKLNITAMVENMHVRPCVEFSTGAEMREFLDEMNHPLLGACWDTAHCNLNPTAREIGQYNNIIALGKYLKALHISDNLERGHQHSWPFAGNINFDEVMQGLIDVDYDGYFNFEASYTLLHQNNPPRSRKPFEHNGETITKLINPSVELKKKAVELLYEVGKHILTTYDCFEE